MPARLTKCGGAAKRFPLGPLGPPQVLPALLERSLRPLASDSQLLLTNHDGLEQISPVDLGIEDVVGKLSRESRLRSCLEALDAKKRESVLLSYVGGYSHGEIAGRLAVPVGTAKSWVRRGLSALKDCMA